MEIAFTDKIKVRHRKPQSRNWYRQEYQASTDVSCILGVIKFCVGQDVWLMNPRRVNQKVTSGTVSGIGGEDKFHFRDIPEKWFKVDVREAHHPNVALMFPDDGADQLVMKDVLNGNTIWDGRLMKSAAKM